MKTLLGIVCALNLVGAFFALTLGGAAFAACLGAALIAGTGYAILDRLDTLAAGNEALDAIRKVLVEIRDKDRVRNPAIDDPTRAADVDKAMDAMLAARRLSPPK